MADKYHEESEYFTGDHADEDELRFLRFFYRKADSAMGPASDDIYRMIKGFFTEKTGIEVPPAYYPPVE